MTRKNKTFKSLMRANGFVPDPAGAAADSLVAGYNAIAAEMGMPPLFYVLDDGSLQLHPQVVAILQANPDLRAQFEARLGSP